MAPSAQSEHIIPRTGSAVEWLSLDRDLAERSLEVMMPHYSYNGEMDLSGIKASIHVISSRGGRFKKSLSPEDVVDFSLLEEVWKETRARGGSPQRRLEGER